MGRDCRKRDKIDRGVMRKKIKKILSSKIFYYIIFAILSLQVVSWFHGNNIINISDFSYMLSPFSDLEKFWFRWDHTRGLGVSQDRNSASLIYTGFLSVFYLIFKNISITEKILFFFWFFLSCVSAFTLLTYLISKYEKNMVTVRSIGFIGTLFYVLNPFLYNYRWGNGFLIPMFIYSIGPLLLYLIIRILEAQEYREKYKYFVYFLIANLWAIPAYENPAYFLAFYLFLFPIIVIYWKEIRDNRTVYLRLLAILLLVNLWWILRPLSFFQSSQYMGQMAGVDNSNLKFYEFRYTSFLEVFRLQGYWATREPDYFYSGRHYFSNPIIYLAGYYLVLVTFGFLLFSKKRIYENRAWLAFVLVLIYLIKGLHEPVSFIFSWLIDNTPFRMFRFSMEKFYPLLILIFSYFMSLSLLGLFQKKRLLGYIALFITFGCVLINGYPLVLNKTITDSNKLTNKYLRKYYSIPKEYYSAGEYLDKKRLIQKNLIFPENANSPSNSWTAYAWSGVGVDPFWNLMKSSPYLVINNLGNSISFNSLMSPVLSSMFDYYQKNFEVFFREIEKPLGVFNSRYVIFRNDNINEQIYGNKISKKQLYETISNSAQLRKEKEIGEVSVFKLDDQYFLSPLYLPSNISISEDNIEKLPKQLFNNSVDKPGVFLKSLNHQKNLDNLALPQKSIPNIEFKKVNATKYRIVIHNTKENFPLIFSETFHDGWKVYLTKSNKKERSETLRNKLNDYSILEGNETDQASKEQLEKYVNLGLISTLGDNKEKTIDHLTWNNGRENLDHTEKYKIDFISKDFKGTIQNDNLSVGTFWETYFEKQSIGENNHFVANGYANAWIISPEALCQSNNNCLKNSDGNYELELVVEFWPQRLFYLGLIVSSLTLVGVIGCLVYNKKKSKAT